MHKPYLAIFKFELSEVQITRFEEDHEEKILKVCR